MQPGEFDQYAESYDAALEKGIAVSGESKDFFAAGRVHWLQRCLRALDCAPTTLLDFGCGTGSASPWLIEAFGPSALLGVDLSGKSIDVARAAHGAETVSFQTLAAWKPGGDVDLAFCNGVFHHIPLDQRAGAARSVFDALRPGGTFALWENNPWNPGTRYVMSRIPFDRDAIMLWPGETRRLLRDQGFDIVRTDFLFVFPGMLRALRGVEPLLSKLPLGAQYQVLARRPLHRAERRPA